MLFYIALFIVCVIIAVAFVYVFRALEHVSHHDASQVIVQSIRTRHEKRPKERKLATTINDTPTPWGWNGKRHMNREHDGGRGDMGSFLNPHDQHANPANIASPTVGWPYRAEKFEFSGKSYKVMRKETPSPADLGKTTKPWGW